MHHWKKASVTKKYLRNEYDVSLVEIYNSK